MAIVFVILQIFFVTRAVLKIGNITRIFPRHHTSLLKFSILHNHKHNYKQKAQVHCTEDTHNISTSKNRARSFVVKPVLMVLYTITKISAGALIGQSALVYCASKLMEKSRVF